MIVEVPDPKETTVQIQYPVVEVQNSAVEVRGPVITTVDVCPMVKVPDPEVTMVDSCL